MMNATPVEAISRIAEKREDARGKGPRPRRPSAAAVVIDGLPAAMAISCPVRGHRCRSNEIALNTALRYQERARASNPVTREITLPEGVPVDGVLAERSRGEIVREDHVTGVVGRFTPAVDQSARSFPK
jgi:hypothetical protein